MPSPALAQTSITADEFWTRRAEFDGCELVEGEVIEVSPTKKRHGRAETRVGAELDRYFDARPECDADVVSGEVGYRLGPQTVRASDCAVHLTPPEDDDAEGWHVAPPDLVVEVLSPNDSWPAVESKIQAWLAFGVREVWLADPRTERLFIRRPGEAPVTFAAQETVVTSLLPGFAVPAWRLFRRR